MDLYCEYCGEPYDLFYVQDEMTSVERQTFHSGKGCPSCYQLDEDAKEPAQGHRIKEVAKQPFRSELQQALRGLLGDDLDGLASEMDTAMYSEGGKFWD